MIKGAMNGRLFLLDRSLSQPQRTVALRPKGHYFIASDYFPNESIR